MRHETQVVLERAEPATDLPWTLNAGNPLGDALLGVAYHFQNTLSQLLNGVPLRLAASMRHAGMRVGRSDVFRGLPRMQSS